MKKLISWLYIRFVGRLYVPEHTEVIVNTENKLVHLVEKQDSMILYCFGKDKTKYV